MARRKFVPIAEQKRATRKILVKPNLATRFTYTLNRTYLNTYTTLIGNPAGTLLMQPLGSVMALNPEDFTVAPHFLHFGWLPVGVLEHDAILDWYDQVEVSIIVRGDVYEARCWDNGDYGAVTAQTKAALGDRVKFV